MDLTGEYKHSIDSKGRVFIPAKLREEIGEVFYVTISVDKCLCLYNNNTWKAFCDKVDSMSFLQQRKMRPFFAFASKCEVDSQGRALIPSNLREYAGIMKAVTVIGCNNHVEMWDNEEWAKVYAEESVPENIMAVMEELGF